MKRSAYTRLIIVAALLVGLLVYIKLFETGRKPQEGEAFRGLDAKAATALQIKSDTSTLTLQKQGEQWLITEPVKGWADKDATERMLKAVAELKPSGNRSGKEVNLADPKFGLDKPKLVATLTAGSQKVVVSLGSQIPGGAEYYAKIEGRPALYFVPASLQSDLSQTPEALRDKALAHFDKNEVQSVVLQYPEQAITLQNQGSKDEPKWFLTQPYSAKADEFNAKQVAEKLADLKADSFAAETAPAGTSYGFDKPTLRATVRTRDNKQYVITLGAKTTQVSSTPAPGSTTPAAPTEMIYAQLEGRAEVLLVPTSQVVDLKKTDMDLRDKRIVEMEKEQVQELRVERKSGPGFTVRRLPDGWQLASPGTGRAKTTKVDDLLWDLDELEAKEFLGRQEDLKGYGLALPDTVFNVTLRGQSKPIKVYLGYKKAEGLYYARTSQSDQVYVVGEMLLTDLPKKLDDIKEPAGATAPSLPASTPPTLPSAPPAGTPR